MCRTETAAVMSAIAASTSRRVKSASRWSSHLRSSLRRNWAISVVIVHPARVSSHRRRARRDRTTPHASRALGDVSCSITPGPNPAPARGGSWIGPRTGTEGHQMSVHMVQAKIKPERVTDVQAATKEMFAAINAAQPEGIRYASSLLPDGQTFVALLQVDEGVENPLPEFPGFR